MRIEIWKEVPGYEGLYCVSSDGRIRNRYGRILCTFTDRDGYQCLNLCRDGARKYVRVHRVVASAFIPNPKSLPVINHKDERRSNNCFENLEWCDVKYNNNYGTCNQKRAEKRERKTAQYTRDGELIAVYRSAKEAAHQTGLNNSHICECIRGGRKHCGGYVWKEYFEENENGK